MLLSKTRLYLCGYSGREYGCCNNFHLRESLEKTKIYNKNGKQKMGNRKWEQKIGMKNGKMGI